VTRALIAARKSNKVDTATGEGIGLDTQDSKAREFCERMGWEVVGAARDVITGRIAPIDRPDLGTWLSDPAKRSRYDCVVAYQGDRLSRGEDTDWSRIETWAADNGKTLVLVDAGDGVRYPSRSGSQGDGDFWQWQAIQRQSSKEWHAIRERIVRAQCAILRAGGWCGRAPFGYRIVGLRYGKRLEVIETLLQVIVDLFDMAIAGDSLRTIAAWLTDTGIKTERGHAVWNEGQVRQIIANKTYSGTAERGCAECGESHDLPAPAIVDMATQKRAQMALKSRQRGTVRTGGRPSKNPAMLVPVCRSCGITMYRNQPRTGPTYYACKYRTLGDSRVGCGTAVRCDVADTAVDAILSAETEDEMTVTVTYPAAALESEIERVRRLERAAFEDRDEDAEDALRALRKSLTAELAGAERERVEAVPTGRTIGQVWSELELSERRAWLKLRGITVQLGKDVVTISSPVKVGKLSAIGRMMPLG
jgi:DNA invertase Pin-like site-specific DNA recombinase